MESDLTAFLNWIEPHALLLAVLLPPVIRLVGHWVPEELFMIAIGVLAARATPAEGFLLVAAVLGSQSVTDHATYGVGRAVGPRLRTMRWARGPLERVTARLSRSPTALLGLIPARVFPLGRGAWLLGCGALRVSWSRFAAVDLAALLAHLATWSGLGWWLSGDLETIVARAAAWQQVGLTLVATAVATLATFALWRHRRVLAPAVGALRRLPPIRRERPRPRTEPHAGYNDR